MMDGVVRASPTLPTFDIYIYITIYIVFELAKHYLKRTNPQNDPFGSI